MSAFSDIVGTQQKKTSGQPRKPLAVRDSGIGERDTDNELSKNRHSHKTHQNAPYDVLGSRTNILSKKEKKRRTERNPITTGITETHCKDEISTAGKPRTGRGSDSRREDSTTADIVTADGGRADSLPRSVEDVYRDCGAWCQTWSEAHSVPDMRKASPLVFRAMCTDIGRAYIKPSRILKDQTKRERAGNHGNGGACNAYDPQKVLQMWDAFQWLCGQYDKIPFQTTFAAFCGVSLAYIREYAEELTSVGLDIAKRTHTAEMDAIRQRTSGDTIGRIAILNNEYYGNGAAFRGAEEQTAGNALPSSEAFGLIDEKPIT